MKCAYRVILSSWLSGWMMHAVMLVGTPVKVGVKDYTWDLPFGIFCFLAITVLFASLATKEALEDGEEK